MFSTLFSNFDGTVDEELRRLENEMDRIFGRTELPTGIRAPRPGAFPPVNVGVTPDRVDVYVFAAGVDSGSFDLTIQQNLLVVSGRRGVAVDEAADYYRKERFEGEFRRVVSLPEDVDPDRVDARYRDGVLHIMVARREASRPRQISVE